MEIVTPSLESHYSLFSTRDGNQSHHTGDLVEYTGDFPPVRLATQGMTYPQRYFGQNIRNALHFSHLMEERDGDSETSYLGKPTAVNNVQNMLDLRFSQRWL
jgi:hypothetical protein